MFLYSRAVNVKPNDWLNTAFKIVNDPVYNGFRTRLTDFSKSTFTLTSFFILFNNNRIKYLMFFERTIENGVNWSIAWQGLQRDCCQTLAYFIGAEKKTLVFGTIETRQEGMYKLQLLSSSASRIKITPFYFQVPFKFPRLAQSLLFHIY